MRLAVYTDYHYRRLDGRIFAERAFALFLIALAAEVERLDLLGKVNPEPGRAHYELPPRLRFVELPYFASLARPGSALLAMAGSLRTFWRLLDELDAVWLLGPHPLALVFAIMALARRRTVALGVRQDFPRYVRARHPQRRWIHATGDLLELAWRVLGRLVPVVAVGPALARQYPQRSTLEIAVSLVPERELVAPGAIRRDYVHGPLRAVSVGRLEQEKNPLLLADIAALLTEQDPRWRLVVCGEGPLEGELRNRLETLGVAAAVELRGYVQHDQLRALYRECDVLLHVSWTEGLPQVLFEAFAAQLPIVATAVGGVPAACDGAAILIPPGDARAAVDALTSVAASEALRERLVAAGSARIANRTLEAEARRVAAFLRRRRSNG